MNINLKQLQTFIWVADLGSFKKAAARLNTTQPNISSRIASLETALDVSLMERDAGSVRLTSKGQELLIYARKVLASLEDFIDVADSSNLLDDVLRLGVTEMIVNTWLPEFLKRFKVQYPTASIELSVDLSVNLEQALVDRDIDLAFQSGPFSSSASGSRKLGRFTMVWVAPPSFKLHSQRGLSLDDLAEFPLITHARDTRSYEEIVEHLRKRPDLKVRLVPTSNLAAGVQMAVDGYGVAAVLKPMVTKELKSGRLKEIPYAWSPASLEFFARYDKPSASKMVKYAASLAAEISNILAKAH